MATKNVNASQFASWYINSAEWRSTANGGVWVWSRVSSPSTGYRVGRAIFPGADIGGGVITSASLRVKVKYRYNAGDPPVNTAVRFRIALATSTSLYTTDITANYITTDLALYQVDTVYTFPVTSLIGNISDINSGFCAYIIIDSPDNADITFYNVTDYQTCLVLEYTPSNNTVGRYNGTAFEACEVYRHDGSGFVLCEVYRYDGSAWIPCSTT